MAQQEIKTLSDIKKTIKLDVPLEKAWNAIATSEGIAKWWMKNTFKPIEGYEFKLLTDQYGESPCKVTKVEPKTHISFDWDLNWHIDFILKELNPNSCEFTLIHSGWDPNKQTSFGQPHTIIRKVMDEGWTKIVQNLPKNLVI